MTAALILIWIILLGLIAYSVFGGADFGAGVWEFNTGLRAKPMEKRLIYKAIGPVWEANHVWLIFVLVGMFSGFPSAFGVIADALCIPLFFVLMGIVFRGAAYAFRSQMDEDRTLGWDTVFALASVATPFFLGVAGGTLAGGEIKVSDGRFDGSHWSVWFQLFPLYCGFLNVGLCAYLAAAFLYREAARDKELHDLVEIWRSRAVITGVITGGLAVIGVPISMGLAEPLRDRLLAQGWIAIGFSVAFGVVSIVLLWKRKPNLAAYGAGLTVGAVILGWGLAQNPFLVPDSIRLEDAMAPENVIWNYLGVIAGGSVILVPSLGWLLYLFKYAQKPPSAVKT